MLKKMWQVMNPILFEKFFSPKVKKRETSWDEIKLDNKNTNYFSLYPDGDVLLDIMNMNKNI